MSRSTILLTAGKYAVLAGAAVTNTGSSVITGDVGATSAITGFPPAAVTGTLHTVNDAATQQALVYAQEAYNTLSVMPSTVLTGDLGGKTLTPGVYSYASSAGLTGTLTLDFQNQSNQNIIIITGSTLTTASAAVVNVINSNVTNNVFWVVGSSATLGTTTTFVGNILAQASISFTTGANMALGSAIALTGSVTLQDDMISVPVYAPPGVPGTSFANDRDHGSLANGEHLTSAIDFYTLNTSVVLSTDDFSALDSGEDLIRIGEIIGIQAQPVVTGLHVITGLSGAASEAYGLPSGVATVYQLKFMIEHTNAWINTDMTGTVPGTLAYALVNETLLCPLPFSGASFVMNTASPFTGANAALIFTPIY